MTQTPPDPTQPANAQQPQEATPDLTAPGAEIPGAEIPGEATSLGISAQSGMQRHWLDAGEEFLAKVYADGRRYHGDYDRQRERDRISERIGGLTWRALSGMFPLSPCLFLEQIVPQLPLQPVNAVAINGYLYCPDGPETATYSLYGVEGMVGSNRWRIYLLDRGVAGIPLAYDEHVPHPALPPDQPCDFNQPDRLNESHRGPGKEPDRLPE